MKTVLLFIITAFVIANAISQDAIIYKLPDGISPVIDGYVDNLWYMSKEFNIDKPFADEKPTLDIATWQAVWNDTALFIIVSVEEDYFCPAWCEPEQIDWMSDKPEIYLDVNETLKDGLGPAGQPNGHYQFAPAFIEGETQYYFSGYSYHGWEYSYSYKIDDPDYIFEYAIPWSSLTDKNGVIFDPYGGRSIGFDVTVIDRDEGEDIRKRAVWMNDGNGSAFDESWNTMDNCGILAFEEMQPNDTILCGTERVAYTSFDVPTDSIIDYIWNSDGGEIVYSGKNHAIMKWNTAGEKYISLIISKITGDKDTFESKITVYPEFLVSLGEDFTISKDTVFTITPVTVNGVIPFNYFWNSQAGDSFFTGSLKKSSYVSIRIEDHVGCIATDNILITIPRTDLIIPDNEFLYALIDQGVDTNGDSLISFTEAKAIKHLNVSSKNISSLAGIDSFTNLNTLYCSNNKLTSLDISNNTYLEILECNNNQLISFDVSNNKSLKHLLCNNNQLTTLDVSNNTALEYLHLSNMPALHEVCVWEIPFPPAGVDADTTGSPNAYFTTECIYNNNVFIPDTTFLYALIDRGVDQNGDSLISYAEAEAITSLNVSCKNISDMTGIEAFVNLETLYCSSNELTHLNVSNNAALQVLSCYMNQLPSLDVSNNTALTELDCAFNKFTSLDVSNNTALWRFYCHYNQITNVDVSNNIYLTRLYCFVNKLTSLDVSNNIYLRYLNCYKNGITSLDISNNTRLTELICDENQITNLDVTKNIHLLELQCCFNPLTSLDVSNNTVLTKLICWGNQFTSLDISNNTNLKNLRLTGMPNLYKVCVWEMPFPPDSIEVNTTGSPNVDFTTKCGANYVFIPDTAFLYALIDEGVDTNGDSHISYAEAESITYLNVSAKNILDMTGIEAFVNLVTLHCASNKLTSLSISNNTSLEHLRCHENQLTSLDISNNTSLTELWCGSNHLTSLDVSNNVVLTWFRCQDNPLPNLDVSSCAVLTDLRCVRNQLTTLDVSYNTALTKLYCNENQLTSLDVSNNNALEYLACHDNEFTSLDISNNTLLEFLTLSTMPSLYEVCVWEMPFAPAGVHIDTSGSPNVYFTTNCWAESPTVYDTIFYIEENSPDKTAVGYVQATDPEDNLFEFAIMDGNINETFSINYQGKLIVENTDALDYESIPQFILTVVVKEVVEPIFSDTATVTIILQDVVEETFIRAHASIKKLTIHPNPADDIINIEIENTNSATIEIYNISGGLVFSKKLNSRLEKIDISGLSEGMYFVKIRQQNNVRVEKLIVY